MPSLEPGTDQRYLRLGRSLALPMRVFAITWFLKAATNRSHC